MRQYHIFLTNGVNFQFQSNKTLRDVKRDVAQDEFMDLDNGFVRCANVVGVVDVTATHMAQVLNDIPVEGVTKQ